MRRHVHVNTMMVWMWVWRVLLAGAIAILWAGGAALLAGEWPPPWWVDAFCAAASLLLACWAIAPPVPDDYPTSDELMRWWRRGQ